MNKIDNKDLMIIKESKKKSISQIAAIGRKYKIFMFPILLFLVLFIFVYNFAYYFCLYFKMKERTAKAIAMAMCVILCVTSIDITAFAFTGDADSDKYIVGISSLSDEIANQKVKTDATLENIKFPESLDVHVTYQVEKETEVEVEEEQVTPTSTPTPTPTPSAESTPTVEPTPSADVSPTETPTGDDGNAPEAVDEENIQNSDVPEQNPSVEEQPEENNQNDLQSDATQSEDTQSGDTQSQPEGEQLTKAESAGYDSMETVYVPMKYYAAGPSVEEVVVETLEKKDSNDESGSEDKETKTETKKETVVEDVEEDVTVSVEWSIDEERSSKAEFKDLEVGEKYIFVPTITEEGFELADDVELPIITVTVEEKQVAFEKSVTVDDVVITVTADEGVLPEGVTIEARKVTTSEEKEVEEAIDEVRDEEKNVAVSYTFDITIYDKDGNEIEPDTEKGSVKVTFKMAEIANENLETDVYHVEETDAGLNAEGLDVNTEEGDADEAAIETDGFSFYTVEFTYGALQYVLEGDEKVALSEILDAVGIKENGEISKVEGSNDELFMPILEDNIWYIEAIYAFNTREKLIVTVAEIDYVIEVTDANYVASFTINGTTTNYETFAAAVSAANASAGGVIKLLQNTSTSAFQITKNTTLNLNGKTLTTTGVTKYIDKGAAAITVGTNVNMTIEGGGTITTSNLSGSCYVLVTASGSVCHVEKDVYIRADVQNRTNIELRTICAGDNSKIYFKDAKVEVVNAVNNETKLAVLVAWNGEIYVDGGEYIWGNNHTDWSGVLDSVNKITIYDGKFNGRIWCSGSGTYTIYGGEFSQQNIYLNSATEYESWDKYINGATVTDLGSGNTYRYKVTVPKCTINTETNSVNAGSASANPSSGKKGETITVKATPKDGYKFTNWSGDASGTTNSILKTIQDGDINKTYTYKANFALAGTPVPSANDIKDTSMTISWDAVTAATGYDLYVSTDSNCNTSYVLGYAPKSGTATSVSVTGLDINTKYYYKVVAKAPDNLTSSSQICNAVTQKGTAVVANIPQPKTPEYTGTQLELITAGSANGGTLKYSLDGSNYSENIPRATDAGNYTVYYKVFGDSNHNDSQVQSLTVSIAKAGCVVTSPTGKINLKYTGSAQELLETAGAVSGGTMNYSLAKDGSYTTTIPTGINAGTYSVWYKGIGDSNHKDSTPVEIKVTIAKVPCEVNAPTANVLTYTGNSQALVTEGSVISGAIKLQYCSTQDGTYTDTVPNGTNAGTYSVWYKGIGDANHEDGIPEEVKVTIAKADCSYTAPKALSLKFTGSAQELVEAGTTNDGTFYYKLTLLGDYSTDIPTATKRDEYKVWYKIVGDSNHNDVDPQSVSVVIDKNVRDTITVSMSNYTYEQEEAIPTPATNPTKEDLYEKPVITYFYNTTDSNAGGTEWKSMNSTSLNSGTYYMYAVVEETDSYLEYTTDTTPFTVNKTTAYTITPPTGKLTYGQKLSEAILEGGSASKQGDFAWTDAVKDILPKVSDSDLTGYSMVFTPSGDDALNYAPVTVTTTVTVAKKKANPEISNVKVDDAGNVTETITEAEGILTVGTDYERIVKVEPEKPGDTSTNYTITYNFIGNYTGTVTKKISVPKSQKPGDNIISTAQNDPKSEVQYKPEIAPVSYDDAKKVINDEIRKVGQDSSSDQRDKAQKIVDMIDDGEESEIVYNAELCVEMKAFDSAPTEDEAVRSHVDTNMPRVNKEDIRYVDISVYLTYTAQISGDENTKIIQSKKQIHDMSEVDVNETITMEVPADLRIVPSGYERTYYIVRAHRNSDDTIETKTLAQTKSTLIKFTSDKFSTYALMYSDSLKPKEPDDPIGPDEPTEPSDPGANLPNKIAPLNPSVGTGFKAPKTGDMSALYVLIGLFIVGAVVFVSGSRKKTRK